ncbi:MAG: cbb3-type cytochrome c oxidase N-terminal domain-containing protein [Sandaracinaceae bacterium]
MSDVERHDAIQGEIVHEYDGIEEADNSLPRWWLATFYGAIVFSLLYWFYYHEYEMGPLQPDVYAEEMAERAASGEVDEETLVSLASQSAVVASGQEVFASNCVACHREDGGGNIGPNLTDSHWLYGGTGVEIYTSIHEGRPNGMPAWGSILGETPVRAATAYVLSMRDTNVANGKEPQGDPYDPNAPAGGGQSADTAEETAGEGSEATGAAAGDAVGGEDSPGAESTAGARGEGEGGGAGSAGEAGSQAGGEAGSQAGGEAGSQAGGAAGTGAGSEAGSQAGGAAGTGAGSASMAAAGGGRVGTP